MLFVDGLKRVLQTKKDASLSGRAGRTVSGAVVYDALGRSVAQHYPVAEFGSGITTFNTSVDGVAPTLTTYDALDRTLSVTLPDGSTTTTAYGLGTDADGQSQFQTTVTDALGNQKATYKDARELITAVEEWLTTPTREVLTTRYAYDPMKQITTVVDARGNTTGVTYDNLGRRLSINNLDTGKTERVYDLAGNLVKKITATLREQGADNAITYRYEYGRLLAIQYPTFPANDVSYEYGPPGAPDNRAGRITKVTHQAGTEERWYGKLGEVVREVDTILVAPPGGKGGDSQNRPEVYTTRYQYDSWGRMVSLIYPDGDVLNYHYDVGGQVNKLTGEKGGAVRTYVAAIHYDAFEQRSLIQYGNGVETTYTYDPKRRYLEHLTSTSKGGTFQNLSYDFDAVGNILSRTNDTRPIDGVGGESRQAYDYDSLYRLTRAEGQYTGASGPEAYSLTMRYDALHNIVNKSQVHTRGVSGSESLVHGTSYDWAYAYEGTHPHAPSRIGERTFRYDANGNQLEWSTDNGKQSRQILWDDENRLQRVEDDTRITTFAYDDQGTRVVKQSKRRTGGTGQETLYLNAYYQITNRSVVTKHVLVGSSRLLTKHSGGAIVYRQSAQETRVKDTATDKRLPHFRDSQEKSAPTLQGQATGQTTDKGNHGKSAEAPGQVKQAEAGSSGKGKGGNDKANGNTNNGNTNNANTNNANTNNANTNNANTHGTAGLNGLAHRAERANEVAQNVNKNPHLRALTQDPGSPYYTGGDTPGDSSGDGLTDYTGETAVIIGPTTERLYYFHPDHLGSTGYVTDEDGVLAEHVEYFAFGETWVQEGGPKASHYLYTGKELDTETGLYYYGARYYDPRTSIWVSADPILEKYLPNLSDRIRAEKEKTQYKPEESLPGLGGIYRPININLYRYASLNPVAYSDPDGNADISLKAGWAFGLGAQYKNSLGVTVGAHGEYNYHSITYSTAGTTQSSGWEVFAGLYDRKNPDNNVGVALGQEKTAPYDPSKCIDQNCAHIIDNVDKNEAALENAPLLPKFEAKAQTGNAEGKNDGQRGEIQIKLFVFTLAITLDPESK